jgi:hypothetical protein
MIYRKSYLDFGSDVLAQLLVALRLRRRSLRPLMLPRI